MITDAMIEKAARAICKEWGYEWDGDPDEDSQVAPEISQGYDDRLDKRLYREAARAALSAVAPMIREECAKVAEATTSYDDRLQQSAGCLPTGKRIAAAIRALDPGGKNGLVR